jgi:serine/threonine-protein kinase
MGAMPEDKRPAGDALAPTHASDPTLTPSKAFAIDATAPLSDPDSMVVPSNAALPARYKLGTRLGAGGMGEVLLATDQQIGRDVALKRMLVSSAAAEARFLREARIQGRLEHPAIVPVHELGTDVDGRPFFVMKRVTGTTLADLLARDAVKDQRQKLLRAFADVCLAVEFAHSRGIVHRDLKPANIMLGDFGEVYILDWGIARILDEADDAIASTSQPAVADRTQIGAVLGTPGYMSPEQLRGQPIDGRSDVFALGCILFELIGGQPLLPRTIDGLEEAFSTIVRRASTRARLRDMAPELVALCVEATNLDLDKRLPSARALGEGIERYLDGDRDLELRKTLAEAHTTAARTALAGDDTENQRAIAMKELGQAIALDPKSSTAIEMASNLLLKPPHKTPAEVEQRLAAIADETSRRRSTFVATIAFGFILFLPLFMWMGIKDARWMIAFAVAVLVNGAYALTIARRKRAASPAALYVAAVLNAIVLGVVARIFSPFLVAPGIAAVGVTMFVSDPRLRASIVAPLFVVGVLLPWFLELAHVIPATMQTAGGRLVLTSTGIHASLLPTSLALALYATLMISLAAYVANWMGEAVRASLRSVELQAWHLRQLVAR